MASQESGMMPRILAVDDTAETIKIFKIVVHRLAQTWRLESAGSADDAMQAYHKAKEENDPFALIITDIAMPERSGLSLVKDIRDGGDWSTLIVFYTAHDGAINHQAAQDLGSVDYIVKPIDPAVLVQRIADVLK